MGPLFLQKVGIIYVEVFFSMINVLEGDKKNHIWATFKTINNAILLRVAALQKLINVHFKSTSNIVNIKGRLSQDALKQTINTLLTYVV